MTDSTEHEIDVAKASWAERFFLLRPTFGILATLLLIAGGLMAASVLVKESFPDLSIPQASISTEWAGADPQTIEQDITDVIEKEVKTLRGLKSVTSSSFDSFSMVAVEFDAGANLSESMQLLRSKVSDAESKLPQGAGTPRITQVSVDDRPILTVVLYGDIDAGVLSRTAQDLEERLEAVAGVNEADIAGMRDEVVSVRLYPDRTLALGLSPTVVRDAIQNANVDMPWGEIESEQFGTSVRFYGRFRSVGDLENLPVARLGSAGQGRIVRLGEVADVRRDLEKETSRAFFSWQGGEYASSIEVSVKKAPGTDTLAVIEAVRQELDATTGGTDWPPQLKYEITQDESEQVRESLGNVFNNAWQAMLAVFFILFMLLTWREGLIAGLAIPLTFLGALLIIWLLGFTLNQLVVIGMVLALGLLVDVFILMMEGIHEGIFVEGLTFSQAALKTVRRYGLPAATGQLTTILALAPLAAIGGTSGQFIRVLPITAIVCLLVAFFVALAISVPLSRFLLGHLDASDGNKETRADRLTARYGQRLRDWSLASTLTSRPRAALVVAGAFGVFLLSLVGFSKVPLVMYPKADGVKLGITVELSPSTTLPSSQIVAESLGSILREKPYFESVVMLVGQKSPLAQVTLQDALSPSTGENYVGFSCIFKERDLRDKDGYEYADDLRSELRPILDEMAAVATLELVPETGEPSAVAPVQIALLGTDMGRLRSISADVQAILQRTPGAVEVRDNLGNVRPEVKLIPRREAMDFYGLTERELAAQVRIALGNDEVAKFDIGGLDDDLSLQLGMAWPSRGGDIGGPTTLGEMALVRAFAPDGAVVPLLSVLTPESGTSTLSITHENGKRSISVLAKTAGSTPQEIVEAITPELEALKATWPSGYSFRFAGEVAETAETFGSAGIMLVVAIMLVFSVLVLQFGSFRQSFIIAMAIPLALIGTFAGFFFAWIPFSFFAMVGVIALIGIVVNDSIVMVDTMNRHLASGIKVATAAARGASDRLRPIVSTSLTTIVGLVPLAISDPMWRPLCYAIIFGLIVSTVTSLVVVPCLYLLLTPKTKPS
ncbi:Swarming motility protein SwrC [Planctomycetes bacterium Poly30]|uniref:Swarming motility protein SwrC n=1 Tax=Saltatorellus ferox TaxID=2528018 RepID=A0A518EKV2_9BACT|nr:Swarming motility protein SwrC [Planctomycetes bacterium Poly30]